MTAMLTSLVHRPLYIIFSVHGGQIQRRRLEVRKHRHNLSDGHGMDDRRGIFDCGRLTWCHLFRRNYLVVEGENSGRLPCLQDEPGGECAKVSRSENLCEVILPDATEVLCFKHPNLVCPDLFERCKTYNVKALKKVCAMGRVDDDIDVEFSCLTEQAQR